MLFEECKAILYSDTLLPDIFITEYLPSMDGDYLKVYVYCLFLSKYNKKATAVDLSKKLDIDLSKVKEAFMYLENIGIIARKDDGLIFRDLKEKEIKKIYRMKTTSTPDEAVQSTDRNKKRNSVITSINNTFFQGVMAPSWYTDIDTWFDMYLFDEDVMYALFQHCSIHKGLSKQYIAKVAENWHSKNINNYFDLEKYLDDYQKFKDIKIKIVKKLKLGRNLTEYEEEFIEKWVIEFKYGFDIIELALKKTLTKTNPNFNYINTILTNWNSKDLRTKDDILNYDKEQKQGNANKNKTDPKGKVPQSKNFEQRKYDDEFYNSLYRNLK
jgi:DnaD/phage-associated family protein